MSRLWEIFHCQRCGKCCEGDLPWDPSRLKEIATFLGITTDELINKYYGKVLPDGYVELDDSKRTPCPFFKTDNEFNLCTIYPVRPEGCRLFPFDSNGGCAGIDCPAAKNAYETVRKEQSDFL